MFIGSESLPHPNFSTITVFITGDDGHVRVYSTKDFVHIQTLHDSAWGKVTALSYIYKPDAGDKAEIICVGSIRGSISLIPKSKQNSVGGAAQTWISC